MRYIELNPVRAGMVEEPSEYFWSSYTSNAEGKNNEMIQSHIVYRQLGVNEVKRQFAYRQLFRLAIGEPVLDALREATNKGWVFGGDRFREEIERLTGRRSVAKARGRPKKVK